MSGQESKFYVTNNFIDFCRIFLKRQFKHHVQKHIQISFKEG